MAIENVGITTGSGARVAVDLIGTDNYQIVKIMQAADGATGSLEGPWAITGTGLTVASVTTGTFTVAGVPTITATAALPITGTNITIASLTTGTVAIAGTPTVTVGNTVAVTGTVDASVTVIATISTIVSVLAVETGTVSISNVLSASNVTVASLATGTVHVTNVLSASGVTVASLTTGTVTAFLGGGTAIAGAFVSTQHVSRWDAYAVSTTSGASTIIKTSGAHTLYVTDLLVSADIECRVDIFSAATTKATCYLASNGGFSFNLRQPLQINSAQSLTFQPSVSGSVSAFAVGYTVT